MAKKNILHRSKLKKIKQLLDNHNYEEADRALVQLEKTMPRSPEVWIYKGYIEGHRKSFDKAAEYFKKALDIKPDDHSILYNYGIASRDRGDYETAVVAFKKALIKDPGNTQTLDCLAHAYIFLNRLDDAARTFQKSLKISFNQPETHTNLGSVYQTQGELSLAEECYREALRLNPKLNIFDNLGSVLVSQGKYKESIEAYRTGLSRQPKNARLFSNLLLTLNYMENVDQSEIYNEHKKWGELFEDATDKPPRSKAGTVDRKLRVGYYSPDFREHSVAYFVEPIFEHQDKTRFEIFAYYPSRKEDNVTKRLKGYADQWRDISEMEISDIARTVRSDGIDIFVDLAGHTANNSLLTFVQNPAPIQVTYLGYPNTTGVTAIQYRITDATADTEDQDQYYTEQLCRLPSCFLTYRPDASAPAVAEPPVIKNKYITFGSFNNLSKVNDKVIQLWSAVLSRCPDSRLILKNPSLTDAKTRERYLDKFKLCGIEEDRINLVGHTPTRNEHLGLYANIDIALDTFPYNGTTTTCEALWMGVPVITLCGTFHASRVSASLLSAAGRAEWVTYSESEFVEKAIDIASDEGSLLKYRLDQRDYLLKSPLLDNKAFVENLEALYIDLAERTGLQET